MAVPDITCELGEGNAKYTIFYTINLVFIVIYLIVLPIYVVYQLFSYEELLTVNMTKRTVPTYKPDPTSDKGK